MAFTVYFSRRRAILYITTLLLLWSFLLADVYYIFFAEGAAPSIVQFASLLILVLGLALGPVIAFKVNRIWRNFLLPNEEDEDQERQWLYYIVLTCHKCYWRRIIGYSGNRDGTRTLVHIKPAKSPCNVLKAVILQAPSDTPVKDLLAAQPHFRDILYDCFTLSSKEAMRPYNDMLRHKPCPKCKQSGKVRASTRSIYQSMTAEHINRYKSWRVIDKRTPTPPDPSPQ